MLKCVLSSVGLKWVGGAVAGPRAKVGRLVWQLVWKEEDLAVMVIGMVWLDQTLPQAVRKLQGSIAGWTQR